MTPAPSTRSGTPKKRPARKPKPASGDGTLTSEEKALLAQKDYEEAVEERVRSMQIGEEAKRRLAQEKAGALEIPKLETLDRFLRRKMPPQKYLIDGLWQADGNVLLAAQSKGGKTTIVGNLARSLVDGDAFMDHFEVVETRTVALLDFEMSEHMLQDWMREQSIRNRRNMALVPMRGRAGAFRITDDATRALWARIIEDAGAEVLILDPLRPIIDAIGLKESNELGEFLQAFAALKVEAGISEGLIVHHYGHGAQRASGDSRLLGWPDAIWNGTLQEVNDPTSIHYFQAYGRDVNVPRGVVLMDDFKRLDFKTDVPEESKTVLYDRLVEWLEKQKELDEEAVAKGEELKSHAPGERKTSQIISAGIKGITKHTVAPELEQARKAERVVLRDEGNGKPKWYSAPAS